MGNYFIGQFVQNLQLKNRVSLPSVMLRKITEPLIMCFSLYQAPHLTIYQQSDYEKRVEQFEDPLLSENASLDLLMHGFSRTDEVKIDAAGRIVISRLAVDFANLTKDPKQLLLKGDGDHLSIWDLSKYVEVQEERKKIIELRQAILRAEEQGVKASDILGEVLRLEALEGRGRVRHD